MHLDPSRASPYLRALIAGLQALAPNTDYIPLKQALAHLTVMDPTHTGACLLPAEIHPETGMPAFVWMERSLAEQVLAQEGAAATDPTDEDLDRAERLESELGARMRDRRSAHRLLRRMSLLPRTQLDVSLRRIRGETKVTATFDRMEPLGYWTRIRVDIAADAGQHGLGPISVTPEGRVIVEPGFEHLLIRHSATPLMGLRDALDAVSPLSTITRLARSRIGPFWFPGIALPDEVPSGLGKGLLLHLSLQVLANDVHHTAHADPWLAPHTGALPSGFGLFQERRFAASSNLVEPVRSWCTEKRCAPQVVLLKPGPAPQLTRRTSQRRTL